MRKDKSEVSILAKIAFSMCNSSKSASFPNILGLVLHNYARPCVAEGRGQEKNRTQKMETILHVSLKGSALVSFVGPKARQGHKHRVTTPHTTLRRPPSGPVSYLWVELPQGVRHSPAR